MTLTINKFFSTGVAVLQMGGVNFSGLFKAFTKKFSSFFITKRSAFYGMCFCVCFFTTNQRSVWSCGCVRNAINIFDIEITYFEKWDQESLYFVGSFDPYFWRHLCSSLFFYMTTGVFQGGGEGLTEKQPGQHSLSLLLGPINPSGTEHDCLAEWWEL